ncbi:MAG: ATP phosphoribosyltransferase regulatory subunit, partial [Nocardioidaceae bacterium]|nr:ATP phosphoribosyltransferase regulatory subunit [Nocardioidaceae bacterium]
LVDKLDKLEPTQVRTLLLEEAGVSAEQADKILALAGIRTSDDSFVDQVRALGVNGDLLEEGLHELAALLRACAPRATTTARVEADLSIARGLDYYTGTVFETRLDGYESLGSICSGGRYDALATDGRTSYPGVGISLGVSRVLVPLLQRGAVMANRSVPSAVLIAVANDEGRAEADAVATTLRSNGISCEVAPTAAKFGKQIRHAERRGIPYVWFISGADGDTGRHEVKDIRSGNQVAADPATWQPPIQDLRPQVHTTTTTSSSEGNTP